MVMNNQKWATKARKNRRIAIVLTILLHIGVIGGIYYGMQPHKATTIVETAATNIEKPTTDKRLKP